LQRDAKKVLAWNVLLRTATKQALSRAGRAPQVQVGIFADIRAAREFAIRVVTVK
jgi:hypothetical protein